MSEFLHGLLLNGQPHNFTDALRQPTASLPRAVVARAEEYIREHCERPISLVEIAEAFGELPASTLARARRSAPLKQDHR
ncbi:hypothetical protein [Bordetella muralis]|uniref:hypothetical protein n=1 Tax=Bordetella muralis TaxID=1649130 RepID=UPI0039EEB905